MSHAYFSQPHKMHLGYLDGLRALAAIFVVVHHAFLQVWPKPDAMTGSSTLLAALLKHGHYAVDLFIVLSGFCLMMPVVKGDGTVRGGSLNFYLRRAWRILPPYYLALALSLLLVWTVVGIKTGTHWDVSLPVTTKGIVTHLLMVHDAYAQDYTINHAFWSIAVEWRIYLLFPLLVWAAGKLGGFRMMVLVTFVSCALYEPVGRRISHSLTVHYLGLFAMGMYAATVIFSKHSLHAKLRALPWGSLAVGLAGIVGCFAEAPVWNGGPPPLYWTDTAVGLCSMALIIAVAKGDGGWLHRALSWRPLVFMGTFAYSIYLIHSPLLQVLWQYPFAHLQDDAPRMFVALSVVGTPLILVASYAFYLVCEKPFTARCPVQLPLAALPEASAA